MAKFATVRFESGFNVHTGNLYRELPNIKGFYTQFAHGGDLYIGVFATAKEAYAVGLGASDFRRVISVYDDGRIGVYHSSEDTLNDIDLRFNSH